jgi:hypothetical protein
MESYGNEIIALEKAIQKLEERIREAEKRLPAHSTKPTTISMVFDLEDERDELLGKLQRLKQNTNRTQKS